MSEIRNDVELLVCLVKEYGHVDEILAGFLELGISGATVVDGRGMGEIITRDIPVFSGLRNLFPRGDLHTYVILSLVQVEVIETAFRLVEEVCGDLSLPGSGGVFALPVGRNRGFPKQPPAE
ncbi:MAG TPA: hypothetical protein PLV45_05575 [bacterium]|nr:hypothetical protein [bacterium]